MCQTRVTRHAKERLVGRSQTANSFKDAQRTAKIAFNSGYKIHQIAEHCPKTAEWMQYKKGRNGREAKVRVYKNNLYIWRTKTNILVTVIPLCDSLKEEIRAFEESK